MLRLKLFKVQSHFLLEKQNVSFKKVTLKILVWDLASYLFQYLQQKQNFCQKLSIVGTYAVIYLEKEYVREFFFCKMWQSLDQKFKMKMKGIEWNGIFQFLFGPKDATWHCLTWSPPVQAPLYSWGMFQEEYIQQYASSTARSIPPLAWTSAQIRGHGSSFDIQRSGIQVWP